jgi:hypothetical protein
VRILIVVALCSLVAVGSLALARNGGSSTVEGAGVAAT